MGARVFDLGTTIAPFGDRAGDIPICGRTLAQFRDEELAAAAVDAERFTFADHAIATAPVLSAFAARADGKPKKLQLPSSSVNSALTKVSSAEGGIFEIYLDAPTEETRARAEPTLIELSSATRRRELPRVGVPPYFLDLPSDGKVAAHVEHWVHVLWLSSALVPALLNRAPKKGARNWIGRGANIHPSAYLEGAVIGERAVVGARCSIRHSYVGARANLADFTKLGYCSIGDDTSTLANAALSHVVALGGGTLAAYYAQDILLGKNLFMTSAVTFLSESLEGTIFVEHRGELRDTGRKVLGGCAGHGCLLGARTIVAPGKALPGGITVVMRKEESVSWVAEEPLHGAPSCLYDSGLVAFRDAFPGRVPEEL